MESVALGHAFEDGNKRTAAISMLVFMLINGRVLKMRQGSGVEVGRAIESVVRHDMDAVGFGDYLRASFPLENVKPLSPDRITDIQINVEGE